MKKFKAIDLFCGAGGLTLGLRMAGFDVMAGVEVNSAAAETYRLNHKKSKVYECDISQLDPFLVMKDLGLSPGDLDLLAGCPPCQGFSLHRTRNKSASVIDKRNDLIFDLMRFVRAMRPKSVMMENVPSLAKDERIHFVKRELSELGYFVDENTVQVKDASEHGVPQRRKRLILQVSKYGYIPHPEKEDNRRTVYDAIGKLAEPGESGDALHDLPVNRTKKVMDVIRMIPKNGGSRTDLPKCYWLPCHIRNPGGYRDVYGRMSWNDVAPTITGGCHNPSKGRFIHPEKDRAVTLREAALLQTFPQDYKFSMLKGKDAVALMIGNALPPEFIRRHAVNFYKHIEKYAG